MKMKLVISYLIFSAWVFTAVAAAHAARIYLGVDLFWNDTFIPVWGSWIALFVSGSLAIKGIWATWVIHDHLEECKH
jgi:hypothetical protein